jgi:hypothetical protein
MTKHTPGPWSTGKWDERTNGRHIDAATCPHIASALYMGGTATADANANLIAAAPDLLAALEYACEAEWDGLHEPRWMTVAREALKKAKGETNVR